MRHLVALTLLALVAGCVPPAPPAREPAPRPRPAPPPSPAPLPVPASSDWRDSPLTPGEWQYTRDTYSTLAVYSSGGVAISCDNDHRVRLQLDGRATLAPLTVRTSSVTRALTPSPLGHPPTGIAVALAPKDALLDAMAFSRGKWVIEQAGAPRLVLPAWAEIGRVVEDCRS